MVVVYSTKHTYINTMGATHFANVCITYMRLMANLKINKYQCWIDIFVETYIPRPY
jgi:hypothetical protein